MMDLLIDVNVALDICAWRKPHAESSALAIANAQTHNVGLWLYCGSTQNLEYNLYHLLKQENQKADRPLNSKAVLAMARSLLTEFAKDKQWLAALAGEGPVFEAPDPEDDQLIRALDRFPTGVIKLLTRDEGLLAEHPDLTISPEVYCWQAPAPTKIDFIDLKT